MFVLGLNAFGHDAAAVLLEGGRVVFAASEERYDRRRHSAAFPAAALGAALGRAGIGLSDIEVAAFPWTRAMARWHKAWHVLRGLPGTAAFLRETPDTDLPGRVGYLAAMRGLEARLRRLGFRGRVVRVPHHRAHAASAALALPEGTGAVLTADGMGEWTTAASWRLEAGVPTLLKRAAYPHSPGKAYAAVTQWLGFRPESDEGKTMGLAAYGDPEHPAARFTRSLLTPDGRRLLRVRTEAFDFPRGRARLWGDAFLRHLGPARARGEPLGSGHRAAARGIQDAVEAFALDAARDVLRTVGARALGLAGGLFLNCALNGRLNRALDASVRPFPVAGDAGAAWGAAALAWQMTSGRAPETLTTLRLGHTIEKAEARAALGSGGECPLDLPDVVARRVAAGGLVAVARGPAEFGPRALGGRSVLGTPTSTTARDRLNARKGRESWRPLAPVMAEGDASCFAHLGASPWMILTFPATEAGQRLVPGAVHADGTARVQTVSAADEPLLVAVLARLVAHGHPPAVLNTSLNRPGEPIANTAAEALTAARAMRLDAIVLGDYWALL